MIYKRVDIFNYGMRVAMAMGRGDDTVGVGIKYNYLCKYF